MELWIHEFCADTEFYVKVVSNQIWCRETEDLAFYSSSLSFKREAEGLVKRFRHGTTRFLKKKKSLRGFLSCCWYSPTELQTLQTTQGKRHVGTPKRLSDQMSQGLHGKTVPIQPIVMPVKWQEPSHQEDLTITLLAVTRCLLCWPCDGLSVRLSSVVTHNRTITEYCVIKGEPEAGLQQS